MRTNVRFPPIADISAIEHSAGVSKAKLTGILMLALASCQASHAQSDAVFGGPKAFVGKEVVVCGYLDNPGNLHARADGGDDGLNLNSGPFGRQLYEMGQGSRVCVSGTIAYAGCATDPNVICTDYAHDYTITVRKVL